MRRFLVASVAFGLAASTDAAECENQLWAVISANKDNLTALQTTNAPAWVSASEFRGTMSILQSCILTLTACIYTALHLNIPQKTDWKSVLIAKTKWIFITLVAPEIVLYMAADQFFQARNLKNRLRILQTTSQTVDKQFVFDLEYAFFIVMGGLRVPLSKVSGLISEGDTDYRFRNSLKTACRNPDATLILTAHGVAHFAEKDVWIYISRSRISDKSKSNLIQKALVLLQVSWTAMQCIVRRIYGLPLTLLEIHTMVHVLCAVFLYAFWFKKPLDIMEPESQFEESWLDSLAVILQRSFYTMQTRTIVNNLAKDRPPDNPKSVLVSERVDQSSSTRSAQAQDAGRSRMLEEGPWYDSEIKALSPAGLERWRRLASQLRDNGGSTHEEVADLLGTRIFFSRRQLGVDTEARNLTFAGEAPGFTLFDIGLFVIENFGLFSLGAVLPIVYGGIHLTAWDWEFPTSVEHLLWKVSCISIMAAVLILGLLAAIILLVDSLVDSVWRLIVDKFFKREDSFDMFSIEGRMDWVYRILAGSVLVGYGCARLYIIVESFISLRNVPIGVYWTPAWIQMIPHI